jgi:hypothetical protein
MNKKPIAYLLPALLVVTAGGAWANGGPFVIKYPGGDSSAKGTLARLDPDLRPAREERLRVIKEDLTVGFSKAEWRPSTNGQPPLVSVVAAYSIENPTDAEVVVDFGFPILRGIYVPPMSMMPQPDVRVTVERTDRPVSVQNAQVASSVSRATNIQSTIIGNSVIYGLIRQRARDVIERALTNDTALAAAVTAVRQAPDQERNVKKALLFKHVRGLANWTERDAALLVEYVSLNFGQMSSHPVDRELDFSFGREAEMYQIMNANLGPLAAIGEQKATQFFALLASKFDPKSAATYESIFAGWGGDVRERSVELKTGRVRPREVSVDPAKLTAPRRLDEVVDPSVYARVDYLDPNAKLSDAEIVSCQAILKNLPVVFTFAPMNLLHYQVSFPAKSTQTLTVTYRQFAYVDTAEPKTYQLAYVVHPASLWKEFGPINLRVTVPEGVAFRASVPCEADKVGYKATLTEKTGELFLAVDANAWDETAKSAPTR